MLSAGFVMAFSQAGPGCPSQGNTAHDCSLQSGQSESHYPHYSSPVSRSGQITAWDTITELPSKVIAGDP